MRIYGPDTPPYLRSEDSAPAALACTLAPRGLAGILSGTAGDLLGRASPERHLYNYVLDMHVQLRRYPACVCPYGHLFLRTSASASVVWRPLVLRSLKQVFFSYMPEVDTLVAEYGLAAFAAPVAAHIPSLLDAVLSDLPAPYDEDGVLLAAGALQTYARPDLLSLPSVTTNAPTIPAHLTQAEGVLSSLRSALTPLGSTYHPPVCGSAHILTDPIGRRWDLESLCAQTLMNAGYAPDTAGVISMTYIEV